MGDVAVAMESGAAGAKGMRQITVPLSEEQLECLRLRAAEAGVTPEELARVVLEAWLAKRGEGFDEAAEYVMRENAELDRRLA
jgi:hypothetical protein